MGAARAGVLDAVRARGDRGTCEGRGARGARAGARRGARRGGDVRLHRAACRHSPPGPHAADRRGGLVVPVEVDAASTRVLSRASRARASRAVPSPTRIVSSPRNLARLGAIAARARLRARAASHAAGRPGDRLARRQRARQRAVGDRRRPAAAVRARRTARRARCWTGSSIGFLPLQNPDGRAAGTRVERRRLRPQPRLVRAHPARDGGEARAAVALSAAGVRRPARGGRHVVLLPARHRPGPPRGPGRGAARDERHDRPGAAAGVRPSGPELLDRHGLRPVLHGLRRQRDHDAVRRGRDDVREGHATRRSRRRWPSTTWPRGRCWRRWPRIATRCCGRGTRAGARRARRAAAARLEPNATLAAATVDQQVPRTHVYAYAWRADVAAADAARLAGRLRSAGVRVTGSAALSACAVPRLRDARRTAPDAAARAPGS